MENLAEFACGRFIETTSSEFRECCIRFVLMIEGKDRGGGEEKQRTPWPHKSIKEGSR